MDEDLVLNAAFYGTHYLHNMEGTDIFALVSSYMKEKFPTLELGFHGTGGGGSYTLSVSGILSDDVRLRYGVSLSIFPGNCGWLVASELGGATEAKLKICETLSKIFRYEGLIASVSSRQAEEISVLEKNDYKLIHEGMNPHSGNKIYMFIKSFEY